ncbi:MAG: glutaredoxin family protein [Cocleimonas sp.]|nr:glutaredoxin family protein [Cocleimonas sp.]
MSNSNTLIVYYREGCHLCEQMLASLHAQQREHRQQIPFDINSVDIDEDPVLREKYNVDVPVVLYQHEVIFYHFFEADVFKQTLKTMKASLNQTT